MVQHYQYPAPPPKKKSRLGLWLTLIVAALLISCLGSAAVPSYWYYK